MLSVTNTNSYLSPDGKDDDDVGADDAKSVDSLASATSVTIRLNGYTQINTLLSITCDVTDDDMQTINGYRQLYT